MNTVRGTSISDTESVNGCPTPTAESRPIYIFPLLENLLLINSEAASEIGSKPSINREAILGIRTNTAPIVIPS